LTRQEAYDIVRRHLLTQMKVSCSETGACKYRGPDGLKCAIGALIPDSLYNVRWDTFGGNNLTDIVIACDLPDVDFCGKLQDSYHPETWRERLDELAVTEGLCNPES